MPAADAGVGVQAGPGQPGLAQVQRHRVGADRRAGARVDEQRRVVAGRQAQLGPPRAAAGPGPATAARRRASARPAPPGRRPRRPAAGTPGRCRPARPCGGSRRAARPARRPPRPSNDADEPGPRRDAVVDRVGGEVVVQHHVRPAHAGHRGHRVVGVGDHQEREVGRAEVGRQPQVHRRRRRRRTRCTTRRSRASVIGSSSSGSRTVSSAARSARVRRGGHAAGRRGVASTSCRVVLRPPASRRRPAAGTRPAPRCRRAWPRSGRGSSSWSSMVSRG